MSSEPRQMTTDRLDRLTYHALRAMPPDWIAHQPLAFEGNEPGRFIARVSGDVSSGLRSEARMGRYYEVEGYGDSHEAAVEDLVARLDWRSR